MKFVTLLNRFKNLRSGLGALGLYRVQTGGCSFKSQITSDRFTGIPYLPKKRTAPFDIRLELCAPTITQKFFSMRKSVQISIMPNRAGFGRPSRIPCSRCTISLIGCPTKGSHMYTGFLKMQNATPLSL